MILLKKLALTASYVTCLPFLPKAQNTDDLSGLSCFLPSIGVVIGLILGLVHFVCGSLHCGSLLTCFFLVVSWLGITGCIHLDGLMDTADGMFSHRSRERMLEIMKDSRVGNFGAITGILHILAKIVALLSMPGTWILPALLLLPAWARWVEVFAIACYPYARPEGMGKVWHETSKMSDLLSSAAVPGLLTLAVCFCFHSAIYSLIIPLTIVPGVLFTYRIYSVLGGHTGDTYGACVEISEASALLLLAMCSRLLSF